MTTGLPTRAFEALDRLNSFVRSEAHRSHYYAASPRRAVYDMKRQAILVAHAAKIAEHRRIVTSAECRDCGGSGRYTDSYGEKWPHCRACSSSGTVTLRFVETTIALPGHELRWHSPEVGFSLYPVEREPLPHLKAWDEKTGYLPAASPADWSVNQPGRDLKVWEVARDLLAAEEHFKATQHAYRSWGFDDNGCSRDPFRYALHVGRTERVCWNCRAAVPEQRGWLGKTIGRVQFSAAVCEPCETRLGSPWPTEVPAALVEQQAVREWMRLHPPAAEAT